MIKFGREKDVLTSTAESHELYAAPALGGKVDAATAT
jgi:hypothetical protein